MFNGYRPEVSAKDQPNSLFFSGGDLVTGLLVLMLGIRAAQGLRRRGRHSSRWWLVAAAPLVVFGLSSIGAGWSLKVSSRVSAVGPLPLVLPPGESDDGDVEDGQGDQADRGAEGDLVRLVDDEGQ